MPDEVKELLGDDESLWEYIKKAVESVPFVERQIEQQKRLRSKRKIANAQKEIDKLTNRVAKIMILGVAKKENRNFASTGKVKVGASGVNVRKKWKDWIIEIIEMTKNRTIERQIKNRSQSNCFTENTLVLTRSGYQLIKKICKGDDIYTRNEQTGETALRKAKEVFRNEAHTIYHIWLDDKEEIETTAYHPFFVHNTGWVNAINLQEKEIVETKDGMEQITKIVKVRHEDPVEVYNIHVEEWETYFVSERQVYVHNCGKEQYDKINEVARGNESVGNTKKKGNWGEILMDKYYASLGWIRISVDNVTDLNGTMHHGIDGVYFNPDEDPPYLIAEAKYDTSQLGWTEGGKVQQMTDEWIRHDNRLVNAVGGKYFADDILKKGYRKQLVRVLDTEGRFTVSDLEDRKGNANSRKKYVDEKSKKSFQFFDYDKEGKFIGLNLQEKDK